MEIGDHTCDLCNGDVPEECANHPQRMQLLKLQRICLGMARHVQNKSTQEAGKFLKQLCLKMHSEGRKSK